MFALVMLFGIILVLFACIFYISNKRRKLVSDNICKIASAAMILGGIITFTLSGDAMIRQFNEEDKLKYTYTENINDLSLEYDEEPQITFNTDSNINYIIKFFERTKISNENVENSYLVYDKRYHNVTKVILNNMLYNKYLTMVSNMK